MGKPVCPAGRRVPYREAGRTFDDSALPVGSMCRVEYYLNVPVSPAAVGCRMIPCPLSQMKRLFR